MMDARVRTEAITAAPDELNRYVLACSNFVNNVPPEVLVGNYTGQLVRHRDVVIPALRKAIGAGDKVLDFGCGVGRVTALVAAEAAHAVGADLSWVSLSRAAAIVPEAVFVGLPGEGSLPFPAESFDAVVSMICLQHIQFFPVRHRYVQSFFRVLRVGGRLLLQLNPNRGGLCFQWFDRGTPDKYMAYDVVCDEDEITGYLTGEGFDVLETWRTPSDSQECSWERVPQNTHGEWLWVLARKASRTRERS
jgi:SAM-dependent methyltransferase